MPLFFMLSKIPLSIPQVNNLSKYLIVNYHLKSHHITKYHTGFNPRVVLLKIYFSLELQRLFGIRSIS